MSDDVIDFTGSTRGHIPPEKVLAGAEEKKLKSVLIIGETEDGEFYAASSEGRDPWLIAICEVFKHKLLNGELE